MEQGVTPRKKRKIGLIGGLAYRAGIFYYEQLVSRYQAQNQTLSLMLSHADVNTVLASVGANDRAGLGSYLGSLANDLFASGASLVAITAVAPHLAIEQISQVAQGPIVDVLGPITAGLRAAKLERVAVFGNRIVMETNVFGAIPQQSVVKLAPSRLEQVHRLYTDVALEGKRGTKSETAQLHEIASELINRGGAEAIVLAGTDLSSFYTERKPEYPFLDVAQLHIGEIIERAERAVDDQ